MRLFYFLAQVSRDGVPGEPGFQAQGWYLLLNLLVPILLGILLVGPVQWMEKRWTPIRGGGRG